MRVPRPFIYLWAGPTTMLGLLAAGLARVGGGRVHVVQGVIEAHGGLLEALLKRAPIAGGAAAMTLGHVVIGRTRRDLKRTRRHERVHVAQYERWGPLFVPAYFFSCAVAWRRGHNAYFDSHFEREAYAADGVAVRNIAHRPAAVRWWRRVCAALIASGAAAIVWPAVFFGCTFVLSAAATDIDTALTWAGPLAAVGSSTTLVVGLPALLIWFEA